MKTLLILSIFFYSCSTERQLQIQTGTYRAADGHVRFTPETEWKQIPFDTTFNGLKIKNVVVKKQKP